MTQQSKQSRGQVGVMIFPDRGNWAQLYSFFKTHNVAKTDKHGDINAGKQKGEYPE